MMQHRVSEESVKKTSVPDFFRNVYSILGLPIDAVSFEQANQKISRAILEKRQILLSTPNLNFVTLSHIDADFRNSILASDLNVADGMPLVWVARLLGAPVRERVCGSDLFMRLGFNGGRRVKAYLFGGAPGVAEAARKALKSSTCLECVGATFPGFGPVDKMVTPEIVDEIESSGADFLLVALGARKGQQWIMAARPYLTIPVISHLGATINFLAGSVRRAPRLWRRLGLEWLWRIKEEPRLWSRYYLDCKTLLFSIFGHVMPCAVYQFIFRPRSDELARASLTVERRGSMKILVLAGSWEARNLVPLRRALQHAVAEGSDLAFDFSRLTYADSALFALLTIAYAHQIRTRKTFLVNSSHWKAKMLFYFHQCNFLLQRDERRQMS